MGEFMKALKYKRLKNDSQIFPRSSPKITSLVFLQPSAFALLLKFTLLYVGPNHQRGQECK
ncbi:MAG: hypothetical protein FD181_1735 [Prolixibacteraceae bacterium]|nr:MAG: hypothetical protein FD181_1735 [Prolixibacteraceae bacterium]